MVRSAAMCRRSAPLLVGLLLALGGILSLAACTRREAPLTLVFAASKSGDGPNCAASSARLW